MGIKTWVIIGLVCSWTGFSQTMAQSGEAEREVVHLLEQFFYALKEKDLATLQGSFSSEANVSTVINAEDGNFSTIKTLSVVDFLDQIDMAKGLLEERLVSIDVRVDGHMAIAWAPYEFFVDGDFHHCGVNAFQLILGREGWEISSIMDTRRKEGCQ